MISAIFTALGSVVTGFGSVFTSLFSTIVSIFYDGTKITDVGSLAICGFGVALVFFGFRFIFRLMHLRG